MNFSNPAVTPAASLSLMRQRIERFKAAASVSYTRNPRASPVMASPPTLSISGTLASGVSSSGPGFYDFFTTYPTLRTPNEVDLLGGEPYVNTGQGMVVGKTTTTYTGSNGGIDGTTAKAGGYRFAFDTDATKVDVRINGYALYRVLVDSKDGKGPLYASLTPLTPPNTGGTQYLHIGFGSQQPKGRIVYIECNTRPSGISEVHVGPTEKIWRPQFGNRLKVVIVGDSVSDSTGAPYNCDGFPWIMADYLGIADPRVIAIGSTGYINPTSPSGTAWPYGSHSSDWTSLTNVDAIIFTGGNNDNGQTSTAIQSAASSLISVTRAAHPAAPIFVFGPDSFTTPGSPVLAVESGLRNAVAGFADSTIQFIPLCVLDDASFQGSELNGTGNVITPAGDGNADRYTGNTANSDSVHPDINGHTYRGMFRAGLLLKTLFAM